MPNPISFRPNLEDEQIIESIKSADPELSPTQILRHGLRLAKREQWRERALRDMERLKDEVLGDAPDDWAFDSDGQIVAVTH